MNKDLAAAPKQQFPEPVAFMWSHDETGRVGFVDAWQIENEWEHNNPRCEIVAKLYTADQLRAAIAAERERVRLEHARELVEAHREAFVGNIEALSKLDLDAMNAQPLLMAVQNWDISTGRARELLRCWVLGTFKPDMLPECGDELFAEADEPRDAWAKLQAELSTLRQQLAEAARERDALQAKIDELMLEFCCGDMTAEQISNWAKHQKPCSPDLQTAIDAAIAAQGEANPPGVER